MTKHITHSAFGKRLFFGRNKPKIIAPRLSLKNYLGKALPNPPPLWNWRRLAVPSLEQMYLNDAEGDCVIAELAHATGVLTGNATNGVPLILTNTQINALYSAIGGYVPGDPSTDNGCDIQTALNYQGVNGLLPGSSNPHKIQGYLAVNPTDKVELQLALFLFENLCFGIELPDSWVTPFPSVNNFVWGVAESSNPGNGHSFLGYGYNSLGVPISTWALEGLITYDAIATYCAAVNQGELYTVISQDSLIRATSRAPNGFNWTQLLADFNAIKG
jgi:hypothetical protein